MVKFSAVILASLLGQSSSFVGVNSFANKRLESQSSLNMASIKSVKAREILDSRGNPTVEVSLNSIYFIFNMILFVTVHTSLV
jgi:hypothetical protein